MYLIGLSGPMSSGKDTVYELIAKTLSPRKVIRIAFADALKEEVAVATRTSVEYINANKPHFRLIMQGWGTDFRRELHGKDYWIERWMRKVAAVDNNAIVVATDVRFKNEAEAVKDVGGWLFRVKRENMSMSLHPSEIELTDINYPYNDSINNQSTIEALSVEVKRLVARYGLLRPIV